ncbi:MAG TPA: flagellar filament capping protein FliD [Rhodocyclaceae bacterium]|nr:flagellar filament capping protein FliD [Rhodocyclaceae bacterium]
MLINQSTLAQFFSGANANSNSTSSSSAEILAKVSKTMEARNTVAPKLNAALASDNTKLSALGKLMSGLTTLQTSAQSLSGSTSSTTKLDAAQLKTKVTGLVDSYNALRTTMNGLRKGDLKSDAALSGVSTQLAAVFGGSNGGDALIKIGITTQADGSLAVDTKKLQAAIDADPSGVSNLFSNGANDGKGIADNLTSSIKTLLSSTGSIEKERTALNKDVASLNTKKSALEKSMTAQAQALAKIYSMQSGSTGASSGRSSLLDLLG